MTEKIAGEVGVAFEGHVAFGKDVAARYRLPNGLGVLLLVDRTAPVVAYHTWFRVGSRHETAGKTGLAHLFEHLMFNETEHLAAGQFDEKLEESGAETNAATWVDWTYYHEAVPKEALRTVVKLEADRMGHLVLRAPQVTSEKEVVANERRYRVDDDVDGAANEILYKTAFTVHPYHWPTIGWMQDIEGFTPEDCERFYRTFYAPNNATVVVVGDVREKDVLQKIVAAYGSYPSAVLPPEDTHPEPPQLDERRVVLEKPTATEKLLVAWHGPALADPEHAPASVLCEILFGGRASRLHRILVDELELCIDVRGWVSTFRDPGLFEMMFTAREGKTHAEILQVVDRELEALRKDVPTEDELARAKARLELAHLSGLDTASGKAEQLGFYDSVVGDPAGVFRRLEALTRVQSGDVRRVARRFLPPGSRTIVAVLPEKKGAS